MKRQINIDYIGVVRKTRGSYIYEERDIITNQGLINSLQVILEDDSKSILDMQACMHEVFGDEPKSMHRVVLPDNYNAPFVLPAKYPELVSEEQYEDECQKVAESVYEEDTIEELKKHNREHKEEFFSIVLRYIQATAFAAIEEELKKDESVILYSHEELGWNRWKYSLNEDIEILLNTNFGMGASSYITLDIKYRDRKLASYSPLAQHYNTDAYIMGLSTHSFIAKRDNWDTILHLICNICQCAQRSSHDFVEKRVKDDVDTFIGELKEIVANPMGVLATMHEKPMKIDCLFGVGNMLQKDCDILERYPIESTELFKARKLTEALSFVESLYAWTEIYPLAAEVAKYIKEQCRLIMEELPTLIARQQKKIDRLNERLDPLTTSWCDIEEHLDKYPEDAETLISKGRLDEKIDTLLNEIVTRDGFIKTLQRCYANITKSGALNYKTK